MAEARACDRCGAAFEPRREHARFCSPRCRVAWNGENTRDLRAEASALDWSIVAMRDTTRRLSRVRPRDRDQAFAVISEAVWWVTIVDATLLRYHPEAYDAAMAARAPDERALTEETFGGLRFVRNRMGYHTDHAEFIQPRTHGSQDARITAWTWKPLCEPMLGSLSPRGREWEMTRYRAYQSQLAGHTVGQTFRRAAEFLTMACSTAGLTAAAAARRRDVRIAPDPIMSALPVRRR